MTGFPGGSEGCLAPIVRDQEVAIPTFSKEIFETGSGARRRTSTALVELGMMSGPGAGSPGETPRLNESRT